ncbi:RAMP superfamily CRISPR-associated protein [Aliterella atlantica]
MRGFRELLLPVFYPVYGVPYIPSSSLKGAICGSLSSIAIPLK